MQNNGIVRASVLVAAGAAVLGLGGGIASAAHTSDGDSSARVEPAGQQVRPQVEPNRQVAPDPGPGVPPAPAPGPAPAPAPAPAPGPAPAPAPAPAPPNDLT